MEALLVPVSLSYGKVHYRQNWSLFKLLTVVIWGPVWLLAHGMLFVFAWFFRLLTPFWEYFGESIKQLIVIIFTLICGGIFALLLMYGILFC